MTSSLSNLTSIAPSRNPLEYARPLDLILEQLTTFPNISNLNHSELNPQYLEDMPVEDLLKHQHQICVIALLNKKYYKRYEIPLFKIASIVRSKLTRSLVQKYHIYNFDFKRLLTKNNKIATEEELIQSIEEGMGPPPPQLLDAFSTGTNLMSARSSVREWTNKTKQDCKNIMRLLPNSINNTFGSLRCRQNVSPLLMACVNPQVPIELIEWLLQKGANPHTAVKLNGFWRTIYRDCLSADSNAIPDLRREEINKLFNKYGYNETAAELEEIKQTFAENSTYADNSLNSDIVLKWKLESIKNGKRPKLDEEAFREKILEIFYHHPYTMPIERKNEIKRLLTEYGYIPKKNSLILIQYACVVLIAYIAYTVFQSMENRDK